MIDSRYLIFCILFVAACSPDALHSNAVKEIHPESALVERVIDGDTFVLEDGRKVRLICLNTPELGEPYAEEAKAFLESEVLGKRVRLEQDVFDRDQYGRYLRYVYLDDNFVNENILLHGLAVLERHPPNLKFCDHLQLVENIARQEKIALWS